MPASKKKVTTPRKRKLARKTLTFEIAQKGGTATGLVKVPLTIDGQPFDVWSKRLSLGRARNFALLQKRLDSGELDAAGSFDMISEFLIEHVHNEDGSPMFDEETVSTPPFDFQFALATTIVGFFGGAEAGGKASS